MSVGTTQPEMLASEPSTSNARLVAGGAHDHPGDGAGMGGNRRVERRRNGLSLIHIYTAVRWQRR